MKKIIILVMAAVMAMTMVTGCNSVKYDEHETMRCFRSQTDKGFCAGYIQCCRFGFYGSGAYEYCVWARDYRKSKGEKVSKINAEVVNGELVWYFLSIAE